MTKIQFRNLWFSVHKWIGLILAVLIIPISLTGSALVWHDPIDRMLHADRYAVGGPAALPVAAYADAARVVLGEGEAVSRLEIPGEPGEPVVVQATKPRAGGGRPLRIEVFLDPVDARVIDRTDGTGGIFQVFHVLHGSLMVPGVGRQIVGWIGVAMAISCFTGIWLWWPTAGSFARAFRWRRNPNSTNANLHHLMGFWIAVPLFVLSLTGVWISFPSVFAGLDGARQPARGGPDRAALFRARPVSNPVTPLAIAIERAQAVKPGAVRQVVWPTDVKPEWSIRTAPEKGRPATVSVREIDGEATAERESGPRPQTLSRTMRQIHDGGGLPFVWQLIIFIGGIIPAVLAVTGILMWWRTRDWRNKAAQRRKRTA